MNESPDNSAKLNRKDRLVQMIGTLRDGKLHRANDLAIQLGVSQRTLYRDMETLVRSGVPVAGTRGSGYRMTSPVTLPPLNLSMEELEVLHLGLAVMTEADDTGLQAAARTLAAKIDKALPEDQIAPTTGWGLAIYPFADTAAGVQHMPTIRTAIREQQTLRLNYQELDGSFADIVVKPLCLDYWGRVWTFNVWCEATQSDRTLRVDRIKSLIKVG